MDSNNAATRATANAQAVEYTSLNTTAGIGTAAYSAQVWFNSSVPFTDRVLSYVFGRGNNNSSGAGLRDHVYVRGSHPGGPANVLHFFNGASGEGGATLVGSTILGPDTWYHLVFVRDDSPTDNIRIYLDGELEIEGTLPWLENLPGNPAGIGDFFSVANRADHPAVNWLGLRGRVDEVAVWDRALTAGEANALFDTPHGSVVFAGDCGDCPELRKLAEGADTLVIACVCHGTAEKYENIITGTQDVAAIAKAAGARRVILTHAPPGLGSPSGKKRAIGLVAEVFDGEILFPEELTTVDLPK